MISIFSMCILACIVILFFVCFYYFTAPTIKKEELLGKSKQQIVDMLIERSMTNKGLFWFAYRLDVKGINRWTNLIIIGDFQKSIENDQDHMQSNIWYIDFRPFLARKYYWKIQFIDGKANAITRSYFSEFI